MRVQTFRIDDARLRRIREAAEVHGCSVSALIRRGATREAFAALGRRELEAEARAGRRGDGEPEQREER